MAVSAAGNVQTAPETASCARVNSGSAAPGQTLKTFTAKALLSASLTTTVTLYTVTAGKTFYITDLYITSDTATLIPDVQIQAGGVPIFRGCLKGDTAPIEMPGIETQPSAAGGSVVTVVFPAVAGPPNANYYIAGFEQ